ncbi:hypothetical protein DW669_14055 [Lachnospiraceae bacterium AM25-17]|nr:hypothetical protein DW669_14055 [Lachnospiraceae bacterium AM25-17]RJU63562.1 hypothetical protein DW709_13875 [Coprococcus sp. AM27-12LB]
MTFQNPYVTISTYFYFEKRKRVDEKSKLGETLQRSSDSYANVWNVTWTQTDTKRYEMLRGTSGI